MAITMEHYQKEILARKIAKNDRLWELFKNISLVFQNAPDLKKKWETYGYTILGTFENSVSAYVVFNMMFLKSEFPEFKNFKDEEILDLCKELFSG